MYMCAHFPLCSCLSLSLPLPLSALSPAFLSRSAGIRHDLCTKLISIKMPTIIWAKSMARLLRKNLRTTPRQKHSKSYLNDLTKRKQYA